MQQERLFVNAENVLKHGSNLLDGNLSKTCANAQNDSAGRSRSANRGAWERRAAASARGGGKVLPDGP
jgi:hypothetical protein